MQDVVKRNWKSMPQEKSTVGGGGRESRAKLFHVAECNHEINIWYSRLYTMYQSSHPFTSSIGLMAGGTGQFKDIGSS